MNCITGVWLWYFEFHTFLHIPDITKSDQYIFCDLANIKETQFEKNW